MVECSQEQESNLHTDPEDPSPGAPKARVQRSATGHGLCRGRPARAAADAGAEGFPSSPASEEEPDARECCPGLPGAPAPTHLPARMKPGGEGAEGSAPRPWAQPTAPASRQRRSSRPFSLLPPPPQHGSGSPRRQETSLGLRSGGAGCLQGDLSALVYSRSPRLAWGRILFFLISVLFVCMEPTLSSRKISQRIEI